jgi:hypothetical protein
MHYCMDKLVAWGFINKKINKDVCPYCGMVNTKVDNQTKGCCKDEEKQLKIEKDQKLASASLSLMKPIIQIADHHSGFDFSTTFISSIILEHPTSHAPPRAINVSLFLRNCSFLI